MGLLPKRRRLANSNWSVGGALAPNCRSGVSRELYGKERQPRIDFAPNGAPTNGNDNMSVGGALAPKKETTGEVQ